MLNLTQMCPPREISDTFPIIFDRVNLDCQNSRMVMAINGRIISQFLQCSSPRIIQYFFSFESTGFMRDSNKNTTLKRKMFLYGIINRLAKIFYLLFTRLDLRYVQGHRKNY